jgi:hypothetical protein
MHDPANELLRTPLLRTLVNRFFARSKVRQVWPAAYCAKVNPHARGSRRGKEQKTWPHYRNCSILRAS